MSNRDKENIIPNQRIKVNFKKFVKNVINHQIFELTLKDKIFEKYLKKFFIDTPEFLHNKEKHYRIQFVMDLVTALVTSISEYMQQPSDHQQILNEKTKLKAKLQRFKACESELKLKIDQMEEVFNVLTELKSDCDSDKQQFVR